MENWGTCVCFCSPIILFAVTKQVPGAGIWRHICNKKNCILESTFALRTPRYNGHPGNTNNS